jgi:hypothetical protein
LNDDDDYDIEKIPEFVDKYISCSKATGNETLDKLVEEVQIHNHTKSCMKRGNGCRYKFPRMPSNRTLVACPLPDDMEETEKKKTIDAAKKLLSKVKEAIEESSKEDLDVDLEDFLDSLEISSEDYYNALSISQRGKCLVMRRRLNEVFVNNYNPEWLITWRANLDFQFCLDTYSVVTYITDYFSKVR